MESIGSIYEIWCPACDRYLHDLWDLGIPLGLGSQFFCMECGSLLTVTHIDHCTLKLRCEHGGNDGGSTPQRRRPLQAV